MELILKYRDYAVQIDFSADRTRKCIKMTKSSKKNWRIHYFRQYFSGVSGRTGDFHSVPGFSLSRLSCQDIFALTVSWSRGKSAVCQHLLFACDPPSDDKTHPVDRERPTRPPSHHVVLEVNGSEPFGTQKLRPGVRPARVVLRLGGSGGLHREVPVGDGQLGVHELKAELEGVGDERVAHQEAETVVKLKGGGGGRGDEGKR